MSTISERIELVEKSLLALKDTLVFKTSELESNPDSDQIIAEVDELSARLETETKSLEALKRAEQALAKKSVEAPAIITRQSKSIDGLDLFSKMASVAFVAHVERKGQDQVISERYKGNDALVEVVKASQNPAMTTTSGFAQELVANVHEGFMEALKAESAVAQLALDRYTFGQYGSVTIPVETDVGSTLDGAWISEGDAIPVGKTTFQSVTLRPYKLARITTMTREIMQQSNPQIENILRNALLRRASAKLDAEFFGIGNAVQSGSGQRPAGVLAGISADDVGANSGDSLDAIVQDLKGRMSRMSSLLLGRRLTWVMNPVSAMGIGMVQAVTGQFVFKSEVDSGRLFGIPLVTSHNVPASRIFLIDCGAIAFAGSSPLIEASDVATLHEEDTTATSIDGASPVRSLWQTNTSALKLTHPVSWVIARAGAVQVITNDKLTPTELTPNDDGGSKNKK